MMNNQSVHGAQQSKAAMIMSNNNNNAAHYQNASSSSGGGARTNYRSNTVISEQIRREIQRFESVHPCIYAIYDLLDYLPPELEQVALQIKEHVVCVEDSFVNSQEWTLSRAVPELKLGVLGSVNSGKSALVHRYLTGSYMNEESPEGGRFKKEVVIDGHSYLLLIRDEGGLPEQQFAHWCDAVICVFSLNSEESFYAAYNHYIQMSNYRNTADIPLILCGTSDTISENRPRIYDESRAKKLWRQLHPSCIYYETAAAYGLNVEKVFRDACHRILSQRQQQQSISPGTNTNTNTSHSQHSNASHHSRYNSATSTGTSPQHNSTNSAPLNAPRMSPSQSMHAQMVHSQHQALPHRHRDRDMREAHYNNGRSLSFVQPAASYNPGAMRQSQILVTPPPDTLNGAHQDMEALLLHESQTPQHVGNNRRSHQPSSTSTPHHNLIGPGTSTQHQFQRPGSYNGGSVQQAVPSTSTAYTTGADSLLASGLTPVPHTPSSTPNANRKNRRISNIFQRPGHKEKKDDKTLTVDNMQMQFGHSLNAGDLSVGHGRAIPIKQGHLYKRSSKGLNKEWKKKYVCLYADGRLAYHDNLKDYMENLPGKQIYLGLATVKLTNQRRPRGARSSTQPITVPPGSSGVSQSDNGTPAKQRSSASPPDSHPVKQSLNSTITAIDFIKESTEDKDKQNAINPITQSMTHMKHASESSADMLLGSEKKKNKLKVHKRMGSTANRHDTEAESEDCEFMIVTNDQRQWQMQAANCEERDEWIDAIELQMENALNSQLTQSKSRKCGDRANIQALMLLPGNDTCADCAALKPSWASLNRGCLVCIDCSGVHRQLGSHISRVRSLDLDDWPPEFISVYKALGGNERVNQLYEHNMSACSAKPCASSSREDREHWIRAKYENTLYLKPLSSAKPITQQLMDRVLNRDIAGMAHVLAHCTDDQVNCTLSGRDRRTPLHLACSVGDPDVTQLLLWFNADMNALDQEGRSALWYAQQGASRPCADLLIHSGLAPDFGLPLNKQAIGTAAETRSLSNGNNSSNESTNDRGSSMKLQASII